MQNTSFNWEGIDVLYNRLALTPNTDFSVGCDYPVFLYRGVPIVMQIYVNDDMAVVSYIRCEQRFVVSPRVLKFICWIDKLDEYPEYLV